MATDAKQAFIDSGESLIVEVRNVYTRFAALKTSGDEYLTKHTLKEDPDVAAVLVRLISEKNKLDELVNDVEALAMIQNIMTAFGGQITKVEAVHG